MMTSATTTPAQMTSEEVDAITTKVSPKMSAMSSINGSPKEVATTLQDYIEAGATWVSMVDMMPLVLPQEEALTALGRSIEVCRLLKA